MRHVLLRISTSVDGKEARWYDVRGETLTEVCSAFLARSADFFPSSLNAVTAVCVTENSCAAALRCLERPVEYREPHYLVEIGALASFDVDSSPCSSSISKAFSYGCAACKQRIRIHSGVVKCEGR